MALQRQQQQQEHTESLHNARALVTGSQPNLGPILQRRPLAAAAPPAHYTPARQADGGGAATAAAEWRQELPQRRAVKGGVAHLGQAAQPGKGELQEDGAAPVCVRKLYPTLGRTAGVGVGGGVGVGAGSGVDGGTQQGRRGRAQSICVHASPALCVQVLTLTPGKDRGAGPLPPRLSSSSQEASSSALSR